MGQDEPLKFDSKRRRKTRKHNRGASDCEGDERAHVLVKSKDEIKANRYVAYTALLLICLSPRADIANQSQHFILTDMQPQNPSQSSSKQTSLQLQVSLELNLICHPWSTWVGDANPPDKSPGTCWVQRLSVFSGSRACTKQCCKVHSCS